MTAMTPHRSEPANVLLQVGTHPLLIFPVFRRVPCSPARDLVYTLIWNTLFAGVFTMLALVFGVEEPLADLAWANFVFANCIGFLIHLGFFACNRLFPQIQGWSLGARAAYRAILPLFGVFAGYWIALEILHFESMRAWMFSPRGVLSIGALSLLISALLLAIFIPRERAAKAQAAFERERARGAAAEKQATLARLKLLEAQVEPHFLYNTLANVVSLIDTDPATAKRMQERLIALLRGAAAGAGDADPTLAAQLEHLRAYLDLMALRMGPRLAFRVDAPAELAAIRLPPLLLQPLVENALRHGLEPKVDGGRVTVTARRDGAALVLAVEDTGVGFPVTGKAAAPGTGLGLANLRERLATIYGDGSGLTIEDNPPSGARVTIRIPLPAVA
jgi:signal transduction histidine kinase